VVGIDPISLLAGRFAEHTEVFEQFDRLDADVGVEGVGELIAEQMHAALEG
jgi:hypothetical protein